MRAQLPALLVLIAVLACVHAVTARGADDALVVGSKRFTESYILGEIATATVRAAGTRAEHRAGLGNTAILFAALQAGSIDLYPDYTGTVARELLGKEDADLAAIDARLAPLGLGAGVPLGFDNSYALAMRETRAAALGVRTLGDLARHPELDPGLSHEFLNRKDGWPGLVAAYGLPQKPRGIDHSLGYEAIAAGRIDLMDIYATDAKIERYGLRVLTDDRRFFPEYRAVLVYRRNLSQRLPAAWAALKTLEGRIDRESMAAMNAAAELDGRRFDEIARDFRSGARSGTASDSVADGLSGATSGPVSDSKSDNGSARESGSALREENGAATRSANEVASARAAPRPFIDVLFGPDFARLTAQHLALVLVSLLAAAAVGVPLGIWAARSRVAARPILAAAAVIQTVPALALLAFLIPLLGTIGTLPALVALFLYALLPIVRGTHTGLTGITPALRESAEAMGLSATAKLWRVELPLATRETLAGIRTAAVISVGTATIAAFIGAGGYGERIVTGLALNDTRLLLAGALPAAALALLVEAAFTALERLLVPRGLRL